MLEYEDRQFVEILLYLRIKQVQKIDNWLI